MWTDFVDDVFVINLPERAERIKAVTSELYKHKIKFNTWAAIRDKDGKEGLKKTMTDLFRYCIKQNYQRVCVFEDDVKILQENFNQLTERCIAQLPKYFDLFYFGGNLWKIPHRYSENLLIAPCIYSTHAIIYTKKSIEYILQQLYSDKPYDVILVNSIQKFGRCFCSCPLLMTQRDGYSDIMERVVQYDKYIEKRYAERLNRIK